MRKAQWVFRARNQMIRGKDIRMIISNKRNKAWGKMKMQASKAEGAAFFLLFVGIFLTPIYLRYPLLAPIVGYYGQINVLCVIATAILILGSGRFGKAERTAFVLYVLMLIPLLLTDRLAGIRPSHTAATLCNCWLPFLLPLCKTDPQHTKERIGRFLSAYNAFILVLLAIGIWDRLSETKLLYAVSDWFWNHEIYEYEEIRVMLRMIEGEAKSGLYRFYFVWGHTLTNAIFYNGFFILNDIYYRSIGKRYPRMVFFSIALFGTVLCGAKMAIMTLAVCLVIANWEDKRWLIAYAVLLLILAAAGVFDSILRRFQTTSLTSGRIEAMGRYFREGRQPLKFFIGYGGNSTRIPHTYLYDIRAAFEFPPLMFALDYGVLFSAVMIGTYIIYASRIMMRCSVLCWLLAGLWYLQINTYYASSLNCHDAAWIMSVGIMIAVNCTCNRMTT